MQRLYCLESFVRLSRHSCESRDLVFRAARPFCDRETLDSRFRGNDGGEA